MKKARFAFLTVFRITTILACLTFVSHACHELLHSGSVHVSTVLVATLCAALLIWLPNRNVRGWTWTAFLVLVLGMTPLALAFTAWSFAAFLGIAAASFQLWRLHQRRAPARIVVEGTRVFIPLEMKITPQSAPETTLHKRAPATRARRGGPANTQPATPEVPLAPIAPPQPAIRKQPDAVPAPQSTTPATEFSESVRQPRHSFSAIVGMENIKFRLLRASREILEDTSEMNANGILLFGEPGNGKSFFAEGLAGQLGIPLLSVSYGDTASKWVNETPARVRSVFAEARRLGKCVLLLDEFDSFMKPRDQNVHSMDIDLTNVVLTEIVNLRGSQVILIAATNFLDALDGAGKREGRFDYKIEISPPDLAARTALLRRSITGKLGESFVQEEVIFALARRWEGFSAARLTALGGQLREMHRDGVFEGPLTFAVGMKAMRLLQGRKGRLPEAVKNVSEIIMPEVSRGALQDLACCMREMDDLEKLGSTLPRGVVFAGPPGTGKTQGAMALAKTSEWAFLKINGADIVADPLAWDRLYREACDIRPCVVLIDEGDGILQDRRETGHGLLTEKILSTLDGCAGRTPDVLFILSTNHIDRIDAAAVRSGRFEEKIFFDVPTSLAMAEYVRAAVTSKLHGGAWKVEPHAIAEMIRLLCGRTIADADALVRKSLTLAALRRMNKRTAYFRAEDVIQGARTLFN